MSKNTTRLVLASILAVFLLGAGWFYQSSPTLFNSPDEMATAFWLGSQAAGQGLAFSEPLNALVQNSLHPRSVNVNAGGQLVPGSFLGQILFYGLFSRLSWILTLLLTPLLALSALVAFYWLNKKYFGSKAALITVGALAFYPAWWYYSARGFLPNVPFVSCLILSVWSFVYWQERFGLKNYWSYAAGATFLSLAMFIRPAEIVWLLGILLVLAIYYRRQIFWPGLVLASWPFIIFAGLTWFYQSSLYDSALTTGYDQLSGGRRAWWSWIWPFGFDLKNIIKSVYNYIFVLSWWYAGPLALSWLWFVYKTKNYFYPLVTAGLALWLAIVYGSWSIMDTPAGLVTIGGAYARYWLPVFVMLLPLFGWSAAELLSKTNKKITLAVGAFLVIAFSLSIYQTFWSADGLFTIRDNLTSYEHIRQSAIQQLRGQGIIITDRHDKVFWPTFRVAVFLGDWQIFDKLSPLLEQENIYYYTHNVLSDKDFQKINNNISPDLRLIEGPTLTGADRLYQLQKNGY